jgi:hypothetical protein
MGQFDTDVVYQRYAVNLRRASAVRFNGLLDGLAVVYRGGMSRKFPFFLYVFSSLACATSQPMDQPEPKRLEPGTIPRCSATPVPPELVQTDLSGAGRVTARSISTAVRERIPQVKRCYEKAVSDDHTLAIALRLRWMITPAGSVEGLCSLDDTSGVPPAFLGCLSSEISAVQFRPAPNKTIGVAYPFVFRTER